MSIVWCALCVCVFPLWYVLLFVLVGFECRFLPDRLIGCPLFYLYTLLVFWFILLFMSIVWCAYFICVRRSKHVFWFVFCDLDIVGLPLYNLICMCLHIDFFICYVLVCKLSCVIGLYFLYRMVDTKNIANVQSNIE